MFNLEEKQPLFEFKECCFVAQKGFKALKCFSFNESDGSSTIYLFSKYLVTIILCYRGKPLRFDAKFLGALTIFVLVPYDGKLCATSSDSCQQGVNTR